MRGAIRRTPQLEEDESAFVSMTDMTVSFLFIVILLLAFFASNFAKSEEETVPMSIHLDVKKERDDALDEVERLTARIVGLEAKIDNLEALNQTKDDQIKDLKKQLADAKKEIENLLKRIQELEEKQSDELEIYQAQAAEIRQRLLERIRDSVEEDFEGLQAKVSDEGDALRLQGEGLFASNRFEFLPGKDAIIRAIADNLDRELPCYTFGPLSAWSEECNDAGVVIEAVQIEGHADSQGPDIKNLTLSSNRAIETFRFMLAAQQDLLSHRNPQEQPVLSVAGYGEMRPIVEETDDETRAQNRRIDLRIIMHTPATAEDIEKIRQRLLKGEEE